MASKIIILPPQEAIETIKGINVPIQTIILDPWYNKGVGGVREDYYDWLFNLIELSSKKTNHIFIWGFPEIVYRVLDQIPENFELIAWLTWYYKNCPSVIKGWRSSQNACIHIAKIDAKIYPANFLNQTQFDKYNNGRLRYFPGPSSVIEVPLSIGFVGKKEQTGHPSQKPMKVFEPIVKMTTKKGDLVVDPMCGSGTTGEVCQNLGRDAILCDSNNESIDITEKRLNVKRRNSNDINWIKEFKS